MHRTLITVRTRYWPAVLILIGTTAGAAEDAPRPELKGRVPNHYEDAATAEGERLGIGSIRLQGSRQVEVFSHQTFTLVYTAGKTGIRTGGGLRIGIRHLSCWSVPQTTDPRGVGYLTAEAEGGQPLRITIDHGHRFFKTYFAWQHMVEVALPERGLRPGETLRITYGDASRGSPGIRVQPFDESCFVFKTYVDALGRGRYLPLPRSPSIRITGATPHRLVLVMPSDAVVGEPTWCIVRAEDRYGNPSPRYRGTVRLTSNDEAARLPTAYTFAAADGGVHCFENIVFVEKGIYSLQASDGDMQTRGNPVRVATMRPGELLLWGDLHGHTLLSDGRGTVEEFYDYAERVAGLDVCAVTDHAFEVLDEMWEHSKNVTNRAYKPGRFVTLQAYEWSGVTPLGGDHNCYFLDDDPPIYRSTSYYTRDNLQMYHGPTPKQKHVTDVFARLKEHLRKKDVFCIPHYGGRRGNPRWHDAKVQRMIEIFSEHRRSEDWASTFLARGHRLGIIASTDNHFGNPGYGYLKPSGDWDSQEIGMAAVAIYAPERTRESVFRALYERRVYATSGDRILLDLRVDGHPMGTEFRTDSPPTLRVDVVGTASIDRIEVKKDGRRKHLVQPASPRARFQWRDGDFDPDRSCYYHVRILQVDNEEAISSPIWVN